MLHIIYRSYGGENLKGRPVFYSKLLALASMVRAAESVSQTSVEIIYLNDGPIPNDRLNIMRKTGELIPRESLGNIGSLKIALSLSKIRGWASTDLIWFAEDDYLYKPLSLHSLVSAADIYQDAAYFGLYAMIGQRLPNGSTVSDERIPPGWTGNSSKAINGATWCRALSTTSTFGARVSAVDSDRFMMLAAMKCGGAFDHSKCLVYQGYSPYPYWFLLESLKNTTGLSDRARALSIMVVRIGFNMFATCRRLFVSPKTLVASDPAQATHLETFYLAAGSDWDAIATDTGVWMASRGWG